MKPLHQTPIECHDAVKKIQDYMKGKSEPTSSDLRVFVGMLESGEVNLGNFDDATGKHDLANLVNITKAKWDKERQYPGHEIDDCIDDAARADEIKTAEYLDGFEAGKQEANKQWNDEKQAIWKDGVKQGERDAKGDRPYFTTMPDTIPLQMGISDEENGIDYVELATSLEEAKEYIIKMAQRFDINVKAAIDEATEIFSKQKQDNTVREMLEDIVKNYEGSLSSPLIDALYDAFNAGRDSVKTGPVDPQGRPYSRFNK